MAKVETLKKEIAQSGGLIPGMSLNELLRTDTIQKRFKDVLGKKAAGFMSSILSVANMSNQLKVSDPMTIVSAAMIAATLDLPINPNLGFAHIVPYSGKAQFQMGWKGFVQLAMRSGQYRTINLAVVHEGELVHHDPFTGEMRFDLAAKKSDTPIGYVLFFRLLNGYEKYFYMTKVQAEAHGRRYSKSYETGNWKSNFESMALKTVAKLGLSKYGILSIEMQKAVELDQAVVGEDEKPEYIDAQTEIQDTTAEKPEAEAKPEPKPGTEYFTVSKVTTTEKDGTKMYRVYIGDTPYDTSDAGIAKTAKEWADSKTPMDFIADGCVLSEIRKV